MKTVTVGFPGFETLVDIRAKGARSLRNLVHRRAARRAQNILREQARDAVYAALRCGDLVRPAKCSRCPTVGCIEAHHFMGYEPRNWLNVLWLCKPCHGHSRKFSCGPGYWAKVDREHERNVKRWEAAEAETCRSGESASGSNDLAPDPSCDLEPVALFHAPGYYASVLLPSYAGWL